MKSSWILLAAVAAASVGGAAQGAAPGPAVRYVSTQRIVAESIDAKNDLARLQTVQQQRTAEIHDKQQVLDATRARLAKADATSRTELQQEESRERTEVERATQQLQSDLQTMQRQMQGALQARLKAVLDDLLKDQNVQIVLNFETSVVWSAAGADLTPAVIARLNLGR